MKGTKVDGKTTRSLKGIKGIFLRTSDLLLVSIILLR